MITSGIMTILRLQFSANKMMKIALSAEPQAFKSNAILDENCANKYSGASWMPALRRILHPDVEVVTSDVALQMLRDGNWNPNEIYVVQHVHDHEAAQLIEKGCHPFLLTCFESPIYAGDFYDHSSEWIKKFKFKILPRGLFSEKFPLGNIQLTFPSYSQDNFLENEIPWASRKFLVAVIGNKYTFNLFHMVRNGAFPSWWFLKRFLLMLCGDKIYYSRKFKFEDIELQETRLNFLFNLLQVNRIDLFGRGWGKLKSLPPAWEKKFRKIFHFSAPGECKDKASLLRNYKFCLCLENAKFPGYVTEKIIEAIVAGVVPVYLGAPDIQDSIPAPCFIDLRKFSDPKDLLNYLERMSEQEANKIIFSGRQFLQSNQRYSYEGFAMLVRDLFKDY